MSTCPTPNYTPAGKTFRQRTILTGHTMKGVPRGITVQQYIVHVPAAGGVVSTKQQVVSAEPVRDEPLGRRHNPWTPMTPEAAIELGNALAQAALLPAERMDE